jgi:polyisoprenoid-binding protein YceI
MKLPVALSAFALLSAAALTPALTAQEAPPVPGQADASRVMAGVYSTDPAHTLIGWSVSHFGFNDYFGQFGDVEGSLRINPDDLSATSLDVSVPITSLSVVSEGLRDHMLRDGKDGGSPDFFGAQPAPARFVSTQVLPIGPTRAVVTGDLTMNGVTKPVSIVAEFAGAGTSPMNQTRTIGFHGETTIKRSDFGVAYGIPMVSDEVELTISAAFEREGPLAYTPGEDACGANAVAPWIGKTASEANRSAIAAAAGADRVRWLYPDSIVTQDHRPDRLNVRMEKGTDKITGASCG